MTRSPDHPEPEKWVVRVCGILAAALLIVHASVVWVTRTPAVTPAANDDAQYLLLARSLQSLGYVDLHVPGAPVHAQYPPVYPSMLALASRVFGDKLDVEILVTLTCSVLSLLLVYEIARRIASPMLGLLVLAPLAFNTNLTGYAGRIASEPPFMMFSLAAVWATIAFPKSRSAVWAAGAFAIVAALTRSVGVSLVAALGVTWLLQRRYKAALIFAGAASITVGAWLLWTMMAPNQFAARSYAAVAGSARHLPGVLGVMEARIARFGEIYLARSLGTSFETPVLQGSLVDNVLWGGVIIGFGVLGLWTLRKQALLIPVYFLSFMGLLLIYPYKATRFFIPVMPLLLIAVLVGAFALGRLWKPGAGLILMGLISVGLLVESVPRSFKMVRGMLHCDRPHATASRTCFDDDRLAFFAATRDAAERLPRNAVVLTIKEAAFYYYAGRRVYHPDLAISRGKGDVPGFLRGAGIDYILISSFVGGVKIGRHVGVACRHIELLRRFEPRTALLKLHPVTVVVPEDRQACEILREWSPRR